MARFAEPAAADELKKARLDRLTVLFFGKTLDDCDGIGQSYAHESIGIAEHKIVAA